MRDRPSNRGVEYTNCAWTLEDSYEEISREHGRNVLKVDSRVMEFIHKSGPVFTIYEKSGTGYVGCFMTLDQGAVYYEINPRKVVDGEIEWPDSDCPLVESAVLPLVNAGWRLTYYDEEHTKTQMYQLFNGDGLE